MISRDEISEGQGGHFNEEAGPVSRSHTERLVLRVEGLHVWFGGGAGNQRKGAVSVKAVDDVSFEVLEGTTLAVVGESGSGKTTVARVITGLLAPDAGQVFLRGEELTGLGRRRRRAIAGQVQMVFQDPHASLNPRRRIGSVLVEVLQSHGLTRRNARQRMLELLDLVGLSRGMATSLPHQVSGGQRQRVGIARALATDPVLVVCDEPLSALDVSIQAQILTLLAQLQQKMGITYVFISHDLAVVRALAQHVAVMYRGRVVELGPVNDVFENPRHPYTTVLLAAVPDIGGGLPAIATPEPSDIAELPVSSDQPPPEGDSAGCPFRDRCWLHLTLGKPMECREVTPPSVDHLGGVHSAACHFESETGRLSPWRPVRQRISQSSPTHALGDPNPGDA